jgi:hypothetical protein
MPPLIAALPELDLVPVGQVQRFRDVPVAARVRFNQIIVTGPPAAGSRPSSDASAAGPRKAMWT